MTIENYSGNRPAPQEVVADVLTARDFIVWRQDLEGFTSAMGARCMLEHVDERQWRFWFEQGIDPQQAILMELIETAD